MQKEKKEKKKLRLKHIESKERRPNFEGEGDERWYIECWYLS